MLELCHEALIVCTNSLFLIKHTIPQLTLHRRCGDADFVVFCCIYKTLHSDFVCDCLMFALSSCRQTGAGPGTLSSSEPRFPPSPASSSEVTQRRRNVRRAAEWQRGDGEVTSPVFVSSWPASFPAAALTALPPDSCSRLLNTHVQRRRNTNFSFSSQVCVSVSPTLLGLMETYAIALLSRSSSRAASSASASARPITNHTSVKTGGKTVI